MLSPKERKELAVVAVQSAALRLSGGSTSNLPTKMLAEELYQFMVSKAEETNR